MAVTSIQYKLKYKDHYLWQDNEGYWYSSLTNNNSGKHLGRLNTKNLNEAKHKLDEMDDFLSD